MCGIAGVYFLENDWMGEDEIEELVDSLLVCIEPRGDDATGIVTMNKDGKIEIEKADVGATNFINWRKDVPLFPKAILLHTRFATQGSPKILKNNHPVQYSNVFVTHNGVIRNDFPLFSQEKIKRRAEVDTEIIPALINKYGFEKIGETLEKLEGSMAIAAIDRRKPGELILAKGPQSPFYYIQNSGMIVWASTEDALKWSMEYALNYEVKKSEIKDLKAGEILHISDGTITSKKFDPWKNPYTPKKTTGVVRHSKGFSHGWDDSEEYCDGCDVKYAPARLKRIGNGFFCYTCEMDIYEVAREKKFNKQKKESQKQLTTGEICEAGNDSESKSCDADSIRTYTDEEIDAMLADAEEVLIAEDAEYSPVIDDDDDEHWAICQVVGSAFGITQEFVDYLVTISEEELEENGGKNNPAYVSVREMYDHVCFEMGKDSSRPFTFLNVEEEGRLNVGL